MITDNDFIAILEKLNFDIFPKLKYVHIIGVGVNGWLSDKKFVDNVLPHIKFTNSAGASSQLLKEMVLNYIFFFEKNVH